MMPRDKYLKQFEDRRERMFALRTKDRKKWTYGRLGEKFGVTTERARQLVKQVAQKKERENGTEET